MKRKSGSPVARKINEPPRGLGRIATWQFACFLMLLLLIWVNEVLDLPHLLYGATPTPISLFRGCVLSACVIITAIITVGNTYLQQKRILSGFITVCSHCRKVKVDQEVWEQIETYVSQHSEAVFSHGLCPHCYEKTLIQLQVRRTEEDVGPAAGDS